MRKEDFLECIIHPCGIDKVADKKLTQEIIGLLCAYLKMTSPSQKELYYQYLEASEYANDFDEDAYLSNADFLDFCVGFNHFVEELNQKGYVFSYPVLCILQSILEDVIIDRNELMRALQCNELDISILRLFVNCVR